MTSGGQNQRLVQTCSLEDPPQLLLASGGYCSAFLLNNSSVRFTDATLGLFNFTSKNCKLKRMHSSRMRTACLLPVSPSMQCVPGGAAPGGFCSWRGVSAPTEGGGVSQDATGKTPVHTILDTCFWKYYLAPTLLRAVKKNKLTDYYRPQRSCGQGYVFTRVCDSVHRGGSPGRENPPRQGEPPPQENPPAGRNPPWAGRTPPDQANPPPGKQTPEYGLRAAVRILLECILV